MKKCSSFVPRTYSNYLIDVLILCLLKCAFRTERLTCYQSAALTHSVDRTVQAQINLSGILCSLLCRERLDDLREHIFRIIGERSLWRRTQAARMARHDGWIVWNESNYFEMIVWMLVEERHPMILSKTLQFFVSRYVWSPLSSFSKNWKGFTHYHCPRHTINHSMNISQEISSNHSNMLSIPSVTDLRKDAKIQVAKNRQAAREEKQKKWAQH